ncbi:putative addiction module antidote protein [Holosporaceae bacterium 'Namur']|nr:putative addiction module antidote protein [Holosporaceae bacterium 'Namur']
MSNTFRNYDELLVERLKNPQEAQAYLEVAINEFIEDHDKTSFLYAIKVIAIAQGGLSKLSKKTHLNRQNLYKALSNKGNPKLDTIGSIINGLGFKINIGLKLSNEHGSLSAH